MRFYTIALALLMFLSTPLAHAQRREGEALPMSQIQAVIRSHWRAARACYETARRNQTNTPNQITMTFTIRPDGRVMNISFPPDVTIYSLGICLGRQLQTWQFPTLSNGFSSVVEYPFNF